MVLGVLLSGLVATRSARAQCVDSNSLWNVALGAGAASATTSDQSFTAGVPSSYITQGTKLYAFNNASDPAPATQRWTYTATATIQTFPSPVPLKSGANGLFMAGVDGMVVGLNTANGAALWPAVDTKRKSGQGATLCPNDGVIATPTVQLYNFSTVNGAFRNTINDDLVMVATHYDATCSSGYTANRIYAIKASTGTIAWTFNLFGNQMDFVSEGCILDYANNILYCGSNQPAGRSQPTLWAISTVDGSLLWSQNVGAVRNRVELNNNKLYVSTYNGTVTVRDTTNSGAELWNVPVTNTANVARSPWYEFRNGGGHAGIILVTDTAGLLHGINEMPADNNYPNGRGATAWPATNAGGLVTSTPAVYALVGKAYVGVTVGASAQVHQIDLATGVDEAHATVGTGTPYEPSLDVKTGTNAVNRLMVANSSLLKRYCIPWNNAWAGTSLQAPGHTPVDDNLQDCTMTGCPADPGDPPGAGQCYQNVCDPIFKICTKQPYADGTPCDDQQACSCDTSRNGGGSSCPGSCGSKCDVCRAGVCTSDVVGQCACDATLGKRACPGNQVCCPGLSGGTCVDLTTDPKNCGGCTDPSAKTPPDTDCTDSNFTRKCSATAGKGECKRDLALACIQSGEAIMVW